ncbi:hypothetical protein QBC38DRAFT_464904 [Podospora fimiseda]|uniref:MARVEL domain-containing protein n=1 Tax=Podospora fimiseda TaxID=252190 RepID=A0AAN7BYU6_9PEZI|nr:hypothetical protein QBC38DRAFT_464904 [Podospora fimiseda]
MGMLSYFVHLHVQASQLTPTYILILFITSVLALAWAIFTLFSYHRSSSNARFVGFVDLLFFGALIAGVYYLRFITKYDCANISRSDSSYTVRFADFGTLTATGGWKVSVDKGCAMLKACFALGIMNVIFFFFSGVMAWVHGGHVEREEVRYVTERRRSHSRSRGGSRRSSHSHSRAYV